MGIEPRLSLAARGEKRGREVSRDREKRGEGLGLREPTAGPRGENGPRGSRPAWLLGSLLSLSRKIERVQKN